jgi:hypothetical protein
MGLRIVIFGQGCRIEFLNVRNSTRIASRRERQIVSRDEILKCPPIVISHPSVRSCAPASRAPRALPGAPVARIVQASYRLGHRRPTLSASHEFHGSQTGFCDVTDKNRFDKLHVLAIIRSTDRPDSAFQQ